MLLEAAQQGSLAEVLIVASALSVQDVRERPADRQQAADQAHAQWKDPDSDFAALINLWRGFEEQRQALGSNALRSWCRKNFLNYLRLREWRDAHRQLTLIARELKLGAPADSRDQGRPQKGEARGSGLDRGKSAAAPSAEAPAPTKDNKVNAIVRQQVEASEAAQKAKSYAAVHKAILAGLLSQIGNKTEEGDFLGARQRRWVHPGSSIGRKKPNWLMAAELVETTKLFARMVAKIEPDWIEPLAGHLVKKNHFEPHWEKKRGQVVAYEQVTLYGLIVVGRRPVHYGPIDPPAARELFIREGLVRGEINSRARALTANRELLERMDELEAKARRRDILADEETLFGYYDARVPADIYQTASFENWYKRESQKNPQLLIMREEDVLAREASEVTAAQYPTTCASANCSCRWNTTSNPTTARRRNPARAGAAVAATAARTARLAGAGADRGQGGRAGARPAQGDPQELRAGAGLRRRGAGQDHLRRGALSEALGRELTRMTGARVPDEAWAEAAAGLENHLKMNIEVVDARGKFLGEGRDLAELTARFAEASQAALAPPPAEGRAEAGRGQGFCPGRRKGSGKDGRLVDDGLSGAGGRGWGGQEGRFPTQAEAEWQHRRALQRLLLQQLAEPAKYLRNRLPGLTELGLLYRDMGKVDALVEDILLASLDSCILDGEAALPRDGAALASLAERKRGDWTAHAERLARLTLEILKHWHGLQKRFKGKIDLAQAVALNDIKAQLAHLVYPGFVRETPAEWLKEYPRYLKAVEQRFDKIGAQLQRDRVWSGELGGYWEQYQARLNKHQQEGKRDPQLALYRWMLEEYRVSLWAQQLGTKVPVSDKRLNKQWSQVEP